mgnify:CR=1 FL=1
MSSPRKLVKKVESVLEMNVEYQNLRTVIQCNTVSTVTEQSFDMKSSFYQLSNRSSNEIVEARKFV